MLLELFVAIFCRLLGHSQSSSYVALCSPIFPLMLGNKPEFCLLFPLQKQPVSDILSCFSQKGSESILPSCKFVVDVSCQSHIAQNHLGKESL